MIINKYSEIVKEKGKRKSLALKAKKESSDEGVRLLEVKTKRRSKEAEMTRTVKVIENALDAAIQCPKPTKDKNQRAFVRGSWSDSDEEDDEKIKDETCLVAQASNKRERENSLILLSKILCSLSLLPALSTTTASRRRPLPLSAIDLRRPSPPLCRCPPPPSPFSFFIRGFQDEALGLVFGVSTRHLGCV
nr:hypothetical protein [Tanacetum cinerariifolium]